MGTIKIEGLAVSSGLGMARVFVLKNIPFELTGKRLEEQEIQTGLERLEKAFTKSLEDLKESDDMAASINNPLFHGSIKDRILSGQCPENAVVQTTHDLVVIFRESPDPKFRAQADAMEDAARRLLRHLHGLETPVFSKEQPLIIATDELTAFDVTRLTPGVVAGIITQRGGETSHFAIVAKQMGIPCVSGIKDLGELIPHNALCICNGNQGQVVVEPDKATREKTRQRIGQIRAEKFEILRRTQGRTLTADGCPIHLWGNIAGPGDVAPLVEAGASGVGMFRTEFIYEGDEPPSEERQAHIYGDILARTPGPVIMRTLEAGGDKIIPYLAEEPEENPNLGWQGLRMCLDRKPLFLEQLRGMLRASSQGELWIMFPFVSALWELNQCRQLVQQAHQELENQGVKLGEYKVGIMIEVPSAALLADEFLKGFDFCSIGTNDLTQFTLAADRMNPKVAKWYDPFHPAVLRLIAMSAAAALRAGKPIGMAGDMASNPLSIPFLIGLGLEILSVTAPSVPAVKQVIRAVDSNWARDLSKTALTLTSTEAVHDFFMEKQREIL